MIRRALMVSVCAVLSALASCGKEPAKDTSYGGKPIGTWLGMLSDHDPDTSTVAARALSEYEVRTGPDAPRVVDALSSVLTDAYWTDHRAGGYVRAMAASALGKFGPSAARALPALNSVLQGPDVDGKLHVTVREAIDAISPTSGNDGGPGAMNRTEDAIRRVAASIKEWKATFGNYPPQDPRHVGRASGVVEIRIRELPSETNLGIRALYISLQLPAFAERMQLEPADLSNYGGEALDEALAGFSSPALYEIKDGYGNPLVYFTNTDYSAAQMSSPVYMTRTPGTSTWVQQRPVPWKDGTGGFAQPNSFQLFSMGADGVPNTADDIAEWQ